MAKLTPGGKKRYSVTLTPARVERFQALAEKLKLPPNAMSCAIDDLLHDMCEQVFEPAIKQGTFGLDDIFRIMGENVQKLIDDESSDVLRCRVSEEERKSRLLDELTMGGTRQRGETFDEAKRRQERNPDSE